jgi:hypothetical protein
VDSNNLSFAAKGDIHLLLNLDHDTNIQQCMHKDYHRLHQKWKVARAQGGGAVVSVPEIMAATSSWLDESATTSPGVEKTNWFCSRSTTLFQFQDGRILGCCSTTFFRF